MNPIKTKKKFKSAFWMTAISKTPKYLFLEYVKRKFSTSHFIELI